MTTTPNCRIRSTSLELLEIHPMAVEATSSVPATRHTCLRRSAPREHGSQIGAFAPCASQRGVNQSSANNPQGSDHSVLNALSLAVPCSRCSTPEPDERRETDAVVHGCSPSRPRGESERCRRRPYERSQGWREVWSQIPQVLARRREGKDLLPRGGTQQGGG